MRHNSSDFWVIELVLKVEGPKVIVWELQYLSDLMLEWLIIIYILHSYIWMWDSLVGPGRRITFDTKEIKLLKWWALACEC